AVIDEEYPGWGGLNFVQPALKLTFADGTRDLVLKYHAQRPISDHELVITLKDEAYPLYVHLGYRVVAEVDLIVRWAEIENRCPASVQLESVQSAVWHLPHNRRYRLSSLAGRWGNEFQLKQTLLQPGTLGLESRRGVTSHHHTPWFALDPDGVTTEHAGPLWFGTLAWSGNWKIA